MVMCLAAALDMHASARRESVRAALRATLTSATEGDAKVSAQPVEIVAKHVSNAARHDSAARNGHIERTAPKRRRHASAPGTGFRPYTRDEVKELIRVHAAAYGIDARLPLAIAHCESGFKWNAANSQSSASGVFQYVSGTWRSTREGRRGTSVFDTEAHIRMAVAHIATLGTAAWNASRGCWDGAAVTEAVTETVTESVSEIFSAS